MVDDQAEGRKKQVAGSVKEAIGKITGDQLTQAEGKADIDAGKRQQVQAERSAPDAQS